MESKDAAADDDAVALLKQLRKYRSKADYYKKNGGFQPYDTSHFWPARKYVIMEQLRRLYSDAQDVPFPTNVLNIIDHDQSLLRTARVYFDDDVTKEQAQDVATYRDPHTPDKYSLEQLKKEFNIDGSIYTTELKSPNIGISCDVLLPGEKESENKIFTVYSAISARIASDSEPDFKWYNELEPAQKIPQLEAFYQRVFTKLFAAVAEKKPKVLIFGPVSEKACPPDKDGCFEFREDVWFETLLVVMNRFAAGKFFSDESPLLVFFAGWDFRFSKALQDKFAALPPSLKVDRKMLPAFPDCFNGVSYIEGETMFVNDWNPLTLTGTNYDGDESSDALLGKTTALALTTWPMFNTYIQYRQVQTSSGSFTSSDSPLSSRPSSSRPSSPKPSSPKPSSSRPSSPRRGSSHATGTPLDSELPPSDSFSLSGPFPAPSMICADIQSESPAQHNPSNAKMKEYLTWAHVNPIPETRAGMHAKVVHTILNIALNQRGHEKVVHLREPSQTDMKASRVFYDCVADTPRQEEFEAALSIAYTQQFPLQEHGDPIYESFGYRHSTYGRDARNEYVESKRINIGILCRSQGLNVYSASFMDFQSEPDILWLNSLASETRVQQVRQAYLNVFRKMAAALQEACTATPRFLVFDGFSKCMAKGFSDEKAFKADIWDHTYAIFKRDMLPADVTILAFPDSHGLPLQAKKSNTMWINRWNSRFFVGNSGRSFDHYLSALTTAPLLSWLGYNPYMLFIAVPVNEAPAITQARRLLDPAWGAAPTPDDGVEIAKREQVRAGNMIPYLKIDGAWEPLTGAKEWTQWEQYVAFLRRTTTSLSSDPIEFDDDGLMRTVGMKPRMDTLK